LIAVDTNILIHADREEMPLHAEALGALRRLAEGHAAWALPVFCVGEFLRVVSHPRVFDPPTPVLEAFASIDALLASPSVRLLVPSERFLPLLRDLVRQGNATGNLVFDAMIAAVCLEHGARTLLTEDRDFARFPGIQAEPLVTFAWPAGG
jgi:toxin-antitoxin system PIN domain toxin